MELARLKIIDIRNGDENDLSGVLKLQLAMGEPIATLFIQLLNNERAMNDGFRLEAALFELKRDVNLFWLHPIDPDPLTMLLQDD